MRLSNGTAHANQFYEDVVFKHCPDTKRKTWLNLAIKLKKSFEAKRELIAINQDTELLSVDGKSNAANNPNAMVKSELATLAGVKTALNIGYEALRQIRANPSILPIKDRAELLFRAMAAQNERIKALATMKQEEREEKKFQKSFAEAAYRNN